MLLSESVLTQIYVSSQKRFLGFAGGKRDHKITIPIFRLVLQNFALPGSFFILFSIVNFSHYFLLVGLLLQYVTISVQGTSLVLEEL